MSARRRWGPEGPPPEAYGRTTNAERFRPLHTFALETVGRLKVDFEVECSKGDGLDLELEKGLESARPSVRLSPGDRGAAPLAVVFSTFPGLHVRFGRWHTQPFPICGCDACDESAEWEIERLGEMIENLTSGRFREVMRRALIPFVGVSWKEATFSSSTGSTSTTRTYIDRSNAGRMLVKHRLLELDWKPWRRRHTR